MEPNGNARDSVVQAGLAGTIDRETSMFGAVTHSKRHAFCAEALEFERRVLAMSDSSEGL